MLFLISFGIATALMVSILILKKCDDNKKAKLKRESQRQKAMFFLHGSNHTSLESVYHWVEFNQLYDKGYLGAAALKHEGNEICVLNKDGNFIGKITQYQNNITDYINNGGMVQCVIEGTGFLAIGFYRDFFSIYKNAPSHKVHIYEISSEQSEIIANLDNWDPLRIEKDERNEKYVIYSNSSLIGAIPFSNQLEIDTSCKAFVCDYKITKTDGYGDAERAYCNIRIIDK